MLVFYPLLNWKMHGETLKLKSLETVYSTNPFQNYWSCRRTFTLTPCRASAPLAIAPQSPLHRSPQPTTPTYLRPLSTSSCTPSLATCISHEQNLHHDPLCNSQQVPKPHQPSISICHPGSGCLHVHNDIINCLHVHNDIINCLHVHNDIINCLHVHNDIISCSQENLLDFRLSPRSRW